MAIQFSYTWKFIYLIIDYGLTPFLCTRKQLSVAAFFPVFLDDGDNFNFIVIYFYFYIICLIGRVSPLMRGSFLAVSSLLSAIVACCRLAIDANNLSRNRFPYHHRSFYTAPP